MRLHNFALAVAGALILSGCAPAPWQRPAHHPANPEEPAGTVQPVTALEHYRTSGPAAAEPSDANEHDHHKETRP